MTDPRDPAVSGADDNSSPDTPATRPELVAPEPEMAPDAPQDAELVAAPAATPEDEITPDVDPDAAPVLPPVADAQEAAADETVEDDGRSRPPLPVIIASVLLLVAIGAGLAFLMPSGPVREADQLIPTADPAAALDLPTSPPLAEVVPGDENDVVAQVGEGQITRGDFVRLYQPGADAAELLQQLIQVELVVQAANAEGVTTDEAALDAQVEEIKQNQAGGDQAQFEAFLQQVNVGTEENLRRLLARDQVVQEMILRHTTGEQARARHILIATDTVSDTDTARLEAEGLVQQLDEGADFAALAAEHSADPGSAANGGDLGWALRGSYVPEFDEAVFTMQPGERRLVQTQFGFHIIEVLEPAETGALKNADMLQTSPGQQAFAETFIPWVDELRRKADEAQSIKILIPAESLVIAPAAAPEAAPTAAP